MNNQIINENMKYMAYDNEPLALDYVFNSEGYMDYLGPVEHYPYYYIKDHVGNIRETYVMPMPGRKECYQRIQYYPSGLPWTVGMSRMPLFTIETLCVCKTFAIFALSYELNAKTTI